MRLLFAVAVITLSSCTLAPQLRAPEPVESPKTIDPKAYDAITEGMTLDAVQYVMGQPGKEIARSSGDDFTVMFSSEDKLTNVVVMFLDGKVYSKARN